MGALLVAGPVVTKSQSTPVFAMLAPLLPQDNSDYLLCLAAEDTTSFKNRQAVVLSVPFSTPDITPPVVLTAIVAGTDGDASCDRYAARLHLLPCGGRWKCAHCCFLCCSGPKVG